MSAQGQDTVPGSPQGTPGWSAVPSPYFSPFPYLSAPCGDYVRVMYPLAALPPSICMPPHTVQMPECDREHFVGLSTSFAWMPDDSRDVSFDMTEEYPWDCDLSYPLDVDDSDDEGDDE